jgi:CRISPR/Cas system-associated endonuclease Cas1
VGKAGERQIIIECCIWSEARALNDDDHVKTRICQYEALKNGKGLEAAKQIVLCKIRGQNELLKKYGLRWLDYYPYSQAVKAIEDKDARANLCPC